MAGGITGNGINNLTPVANGTTCSAAYANGTMVYPTASWHTIYSNATGKSAGLAGKDSATASLATGYNLANYPTRISGTVDTGSNSDISDQSFSEINIDSTATIANFRDSLKPSQQCAVLNATAQKSGYNINLVGTNKRRNTASSSWVYYVSTVKVTKIEQYY